MKDLDLKPNYGMTWSASQDDRWRRCLRQGCYSGPAKWGGWKQTAPQLARAAYKLSHLKSHYGWAGNIIHDQISYALRQLRGERSSGVIVRPPRQVELQELLDRAWEIFTRDQVRSRAPNARALFLSDPKRAWMFEADYYGRPLGQSGWSFFWGRIERCLRSFYTGVFEPRFVQEPIPFEDWLTIDPERSDEERSPTSFPLEVDGKMITVYLEIDFCYRRAARIVRVADWKSGRESEESEASHKIQLAAYLLYAMHTWGVSAAELEAYLVYLDHDEPKIKPFSYGQIDVQALRGEIAERIRERRRRFRDPDNDVFHIDDFPPIAEELREKRCPGCYFVEICEAAPEKLRLRPKPSI